MIKVFEGNEIRVEVEKGEIIFRASDVCTALGMENPSQALSRISEDDITSCYVVDSLNRRRSVFFVYEAGLYALIFMSRNEKAEKFKKWVFSDVLPAIRKTGEYSIPKELKEKSTKDFNKKELLLLQALESLETLNLYYNPVKGFIECKSSLVSTASNIKTIVNKD